MFVIQGALESERWLILLDQNRIIRPHPAFRSFATTNAIGQGVMLWPNLIGWLVVAESKL